MSKFDSLKKSQSSKKKFNVNYMEVYLKTKFSDDTDYSYFENENIKRFLELNNKKKINQDLITLWAILDIRSYIDFNLGNTINLYYVNCSKKVEIKNLPDYYYIPEESRMANLLDIKYIKELVIESIEFENIYLATFEIMDNKKQYRPYVLIFTKNENNEFIEIRIWI